MVDSNAKDANELDPQEPLTAESSSAEPTTSQPATTESSAAKHVTDDQNATEPVTEEHPLTDATTAKEATSPFVCDKCDFVAFNAEHLRSHAHWHDASEADESAPFRCPHCPCRTRLLNDFKFHLQFHRTHSQVRLHVLFAT